jgi:hypothetical protein
MFAANSWRVAIPVAVVGVWSSTLPALAQVPPPPGLDKGHRILLERGLQIQAQSFTDGSLPDDGWTVSRWNDSNFTTVNWQWNSHTDHYYSAPGAPWARWVDTSQTALTGSDVAYAPSLISLQLRDEQNLNTWTTDPTLRNSTLTWFNAARPNFPDTLLFLNQQGNEDFAPNIAAYMADARPDMLMFDSYPIANGIHINGGSLKTLYEDQAKYRALGLAGNDGSGQRPIPVGHYMENFADIGPGGHGYWPRFASESETRLQQFAAWTFGEKFVSSFVYNEPGDSGIESEFLTCPGVASPTPALGQMAQSNRESRNLGPALVRLISKDVRFVPGLSSGGTNPTPTGMSNWSKGAGGSTFITSVSASNPGSLNGGRRGDLLVGYFKPLDESFDGPSFSDELYFMVTNGLSDANGSAADCLQRITLTFDFGSSGIDSLQRLRRSDGTVEIVPLDHVLGGDGALFNYTFTLDGGTGDLFKFNDGAPFVGVPEPAGLALLLLPALALRRRRHHKPAR